MNQPDPSAAHSTTQQAATPGAATDATDATPAAGTAESLPLIDFQVDLRGESCPYPVIHTLEALAQMQEGQTVEIVSDCPQAYRNIPDEAVTVGSRLLTEPLRDGAQMSFFIQKGPDFDPRAAVKSAKAAHKARRKAGNA
ncbi:sulfurtransferase-like selenium metabolism protein YedF [Brachybacterium timonense]|uniref:sulfurtransferase-like selenium metabolism protein YedF n=1 Tax=Brachybacterium timonense TaxID=2050896 RepID=UPI000D0B22FD|nr:sulfurtransferase-like selenium metabolism protein YedF [Brachybacterium timonense]